MIEPPLSLTTLSADETASLALRLGARLGVGDCLLLSGGIGAGKTHFARALIQSLLDVPEDIPSPTYTLVQTYMRQGVEIWHADLYRLNGPDEIEELGLADAMQEAITLIEWPDRLGPYTPDNALRIGFATDSAHETTRHLTFDWSSPQWADRLELLTDD